MDQAQPGWYADPWQQPGRTADVRWWDGVQWTGNVQPANPVAQPVAYQPVAPAYGQPATTPDGQPLAGWGVRLGAYLLDFLVLLPVFVLATVPFWGEIGDAFGDYWHDVTDSIDSGGEAPSGMALQRELAGTFLLIGLINTAISLAYHVGFLMWKQATPGKLMLGLRVRRRDVPGPMPLGTVLLRWLTQFGPSVVGTIQYVNYLISVYTLLDGLWPLWDGKRQALHDKAARTNVVRIR